MSALTLKQKIMIVIAFMGTLLILIFQHGFYGQTFPILNSSSNQQVENQPVEPEVTSTNPQNLDGATVLPNQTLEITFNLSLENAAEVKNKVEPQVDYKIELSEDRKTVKIIPNKPFNLGAGYTLSILSDTKFEGKKTLGKDLLFHFSTISYKGV